MAKRKEIYEPGELSRTRQRLGSLDPEEARRMATVLGGEVGWEKTPAEPNMEWRPSPAQQPKAPGNASAAAASIQNQSQVRVPRQREAGDFSPDKLEAPQDYRQRLKLDLLCAHRDYLIKTQTQGLLSFFRALGLKSDGLNPYFIKGVCEDACQRVERLERAVDFLLPRSRVELWQTLKKTKTVYAVWDCLASWDYGSLRSSLDSIHRRGRLLQLPESRDFVVQLFRPVCRLQDLHKSLAFRSVIVQTASMLQLTRREEAEKIARARDVLFENIDVLFDYFHNGFYPLLMRLCGDRFWPKSEFYEFGRHRILKLFSLGEEKVIHGVGLDALALEAETQALAQKKEDLADETPGALPAAGQTDQGQNPKGESTSGPNGETPGQTEESASDLGADGAPKGGGFPMGIPEAARRALSLLEKLFPGAGWGQAWLWPDLYPYLSQLYRLPRGLDLVARQDPLAQAICLSYVIYDLLLAFQSMALRQYDAESDVALRESVQAARDAWLLPCEEVIGKRYLPLLSEYCRLIETEREDSRGAFAQKRESELIWIKKKFFFPRLQGAVAMSASAKNMEGLPSLCSLAASLKLSLAAIAADVERHAEAKAAGHDYLPGAIENPFDPAAFEVDNLVSRRLGLLVKHGALPERRLNNALIVGSCLDLVSLLDYLLNDAESWAQADYSGKLYRSLDEGSNVLGQFDETRVNRLFLDYLGSLRASVAKPQGAARQ